MGGPFGCSAPAEEGAADTSIEAEAQATGKAADLVFKNGHVQTLVNEGDVAQAVAVRGGDIVYVGDDAGIEAFVGDATKVIDLGGKFLCPGFMDGHLHGPQPYYEELFQIAIPEGTMDNEEYLRIIREFVEAHPDDEVYYGGPFMQNAYLQPDGSNPGPQKEDLDAICSDKPIMIRDVSHHSYWVNSKALEIAGITADTPDPDGGSIVHNAAGQPSGLLTDAAKGLVTSKIEVPYSTENMAKAYEAFQEYCHSLGITGLTNINLSGVELIHAEALHDMDARGDLHLRQRFLVWGQPGMGYEGIKEKLDVVAAYDSEMFQTGTVKIVYDGVTEGATAVMLEPYLPAAGKGEGLDRHERLGRRRARPGGGRPRQTRLPGAQSTPSATARCAPRSTPTSAPRRPTASTTRATRWCTCAPSRPRTSSAAPISKWSATCSSSGCTTIRCVNLKPRSSVRSAPSPCTRPRTCSRPAASSAAAATAP